MTNDSEIIRFTFRLPKELTDKLKNTAKKEGFSLNSFILKILWEWLKSNEK